MLHAGNILGGAGDPICVCRSVCASLQGMEEVFLFCFPRCTLLTQTRNGTGRASVIRVFEKDACSPGFWRLVMSNVFFSLPFRSLSRNPSPSSPALATKPPCSPSLCGYPGAPAASHLQDSLVRQPNPSLCLTFTFFPHPCLHPPSSLRLKRLASSTFFQ